MGIIGILMNVRDYAEVGIDSFYLLKNMINYAYVIFIVSLGILVVSCLISIFRQWNIKDMDI